MIKTRFAFKDKRRKQYFEGWYVRVMDEANDFNTAYIFALTKSKDDPHAFIQIFDGVKKVNRYERFMLDTFQTEGDTVTIADNRLSLEGMQIALDGYKAAFEFTNHAPLNVRSAMGFLSKLPLECYQEVVSQTYDVNGRVDTKEGMINIQGVGYMEKTYGRRFPKQWFWLQANRFTDDVQLTLAGGSVPTLFFKPFGFFCLIHVQGKPYVFGTYNRAKITMSRHEESVIFHLKRRHISAVIEATIADPTCLVGPSDGGVMDLDVYETLSSQVALKLYDNNQLLYKGTSLSGGFEWMFEKLHGLKDKSRDA